MNPLTTVCDVLLMVTTLTALRVLGASRAVAVVRVAGWQGVAVGFLPWVYASATEANRVAVLCVAAVVVKGLVLPALLQSALQHTKARRDVEPTLGYSLSVMLGVGLLGVAFWLATKMPPPPAPATGSSLAISIALFLVLAGFQVTITRRHAVIQAVGVWMMANGGFALAGSVALNLPWFAELALAADALILGFAIGLPWYPTTRRFDGGQP